MTEWTAEMVESAHLGISLISAWSIQQPSELKEKHAVAWIKLSVSLGSTSPQKYPTKILNWLRTGKKYPKCLQRKKNHPVIAEKKSIANFLYMKKPEIKYCISLGVVWRLENMKNAYISARCKLTFQAGKSGKRKEMNTTNWLKWELI